MGDTSISPEEAELAARLRDYLTAQQGHQIDVRALSRLNTGWESDVFAFDTEPALELGDVSGQSRFVLRLYFGADAAEKARHEGHAYALLASAGYPVPHVLCVEPSTTVLGRSFLIMERVSGVSLGQRWRDPDPAVQQAATARFCELLAMLHTIAWQELPRANEVTRVTIAQQLAYWLSILNSLKVEGFDAGMAWLQAQHALITPQPLGLVHWDFHHENILVGADETAWVIDWTQFQATDIRFDLAWTLILLASERDAACAQRVRDGYFAVRGWREAEVAEELAFFEAAASLKRLVSVVIALQRGAEALGMRPGAEAVMTRRLERIQLVYARWLALTQTPLPVVETMFLEHGADS